MIYFEILDSAGDPRVSGKNKYVRTYFSGSISVTAALYTHIWQFDPKRKYDWSAL